MTRTIKVTEEVPVEVAREHLVEARLFNNPIYPDFNYEIDVYHKSGQNFVRRAFTIPCPKYLENADSDKLLRYAKNNIPSDLHLDLSAE